MAKPFVSIEKLTKIYPSKDDDLVVFHNVNIKDLDGPNSKTVTT